MFIKSVTVNWWADAHPDGDGENCLYLRYDMKNIISLTYHRPSIKDNLHYVSAHFKDGSSKRYFNINEIEFFSIEEIAKMREEVST